MRVRPPACMTLRYTQMVMLRLAPFKRGFAPPGGLLPVLLIAAVLLCHGVLGYAHQVSCHACESAMDSAGVHHGSAAGAGEDAGDNQAGELGKVAYAAVVVVALGAVALLVLLGISRNRWSKTPVPRALGRRLLPVVPHRSRGPTLPSLQVFRL